MNRLICTHLNTFFKMNPNNYFFISIKIRILKKKKKKRKKKGGNENYPMQSTPAGKGLMHLGLRFGLNRGVLLQPQNPYTSLKVILAEKGAHLENRPMSRDIFAENGTHV